MLELAILGSLKEQPLHGYELKKRVGETLGSVWAISFGSLYPALRRLEHDGAIEIVDPTLVVGAPIPPTGSLAGDLAAARMRRGGQADPPHPQGLPAHRHVATRGSPQLLLDPTRRRRRAHVRAEARVLRAPRSPRRASQLLERRRASLADELARARHQTPGRGDRYARSLVEHRTQSTERDLEWVDSLIAAEGRDDAGSRQTRRSRVPSNQSKEPPAS